MFCVDSTCATINFALATDTIVSCSLGKWHGLMFSLSFYVYGIKLKRQACTESFGMDLTSAEGQKLECFK
jgi:hypothetical protein